MAGEAGVVSLLPSSNSTRLVHSDHPLIQVGFACLAS